MVLVLALVAAVGAKALKRARVRFRTRAALTGPGATPQMAIRAVSLRDIDDTVAGLDRCGCDGRFEPVGETSQMHEQRSLRVVRLSCRMCEDERLLYFEVLN